MRATGDDALYLDRAGKTCLSNSACSEIILLKVPLWVTAQVDSQV